MIDPPVSLFSSIGRLDKLFAVSIGTGDDAIENLYRRLYAELANLYRASDRVDIDEGFILGAAASVLKTDAEFSAAIALSFRVDLVNVFFAGDLYAGTGIVIDPNIRRKSAIRWRKLSAFCATSRSRNISRRCSRRTT